MWVGNTDADCGCSGRGELVLPLLVTERVMAAVCRLEVANFGTAGLDIERFQSCN